MNIKILKILTIFVPAFFIAIFELLRHTAFHESSPMIIGNILVVLAVVGVSYFFSNFIFGKIEKLQLERVRRNLELEALNNVALSVNESLKLDVVLSRSLGNVLKILNAEAGEIFLLDEVSNEMVQRLHRGIFADVFAEKTRFKLGEGFVGAVGKTGEPVLIRDLSVDPRSLSENVRESGFHSLVSVPLKVDKKVIGVINIFGLNPDLFSTEDLRLLTDIGNQIAVAIENARLHEKVESLATLEERERISREMHDGLAQVLSYALMKSQTARQLLSSGQDFEANIQLIELENSLREVYTDVRETILGLRTAAISERDLISIFKEYVSRFSQMSGVKTELKSENLKMNLFNPKVQFEIVRIIQEALTNVRKHAKASNALVEIKGGNEYIEIAVQDDGKGFNHSEMTHDSWTKFGLQTMRERAEAINGTLDISSKFGEWTIIRLKVPYNSSGELEGIYESSVSR